MALRVPILLAALLALWVSPAAAEMDADAFEDRLALAERLNITAPWQESQAILDELRPHLDVADPAQHARFMLVDIRNLGLAGRLDEALARIEELLERDMPVELRLRAYSLGANLAQLGFRYPVTFRYLDRALELSEQASNVDPDVYSLAGAMFASVGERQRAIEYGQLGIEASRSSDSRDRCAARLRLGQIYHELEQFQLARRQYEEAWDICLASGDALPPFLLQYRLADILRVEGRYDRARQRFERALEGLREVEFRFGLAQARLFYARLEAELDRPERVAALLQPAVEDLERDRNWRYVVEAYRLLAEAARTRGDLGEALELYDRHIQAREKYEEIVRDRQTAFLEVQFDTRRSEQQLALMQERSRIRQLEEVNRLQQNRLRIGVYALLLVLVAVLLTLLIRAVRDRRRFESLSRRDALTALSNHTRFFELAERTLALSRDKRIPYTLVLADIDHFKRINDRHGHVAGDRILRRVAARLREDFSDKGIIGRIGGEEFGIALPGIKPAEAVLRLNKLRQSLADLRRDGDPVDVTLSFGVAAPRDHESLTEIRERADEALYRAKDAGRDCIVNAETE